MSVGEQPTQVQPAVKPRTPRRGGRRNPLAANRRVSVAQHPRIARYVETAKAWGGLVGFVLVALASAGAGAETFDVLWRALIGGVVAWMVVWAAAVQVGRALVQAEVSAHRAARDAAEEEAEAEAAKAAEEAESRALLNP